MKPQVTVLLWDQYDPDAVMPDGLRDQTCPFDAVSAGAIGAPGKSASLAEIVTEVETEFVAFLMQADAWLAPDRLTRCLSAAARTPQADCITHGCVVSDTASGFSKLWPAPFPPGRSGLVDFAAVVVTPIPVTLSAALFRTAFLRSPIADMPADVDQAWFLGLTAALRGPVVFMAEALAVCPPPSLAQQARRNATLAAVREKCHGLDRLILQDAMLQTNAGNVDA